MMEVMEELVEMEGTGEAAGAGGEGEDRGAREAV